MENSIQNARVLFDNGQYDRAIDMCTELIEAETDRKDAFLISANSYMFAGLKTPTNEQDNEYFFKSFECACSYAETVEEAYELEREATQAFLNWKKKCVHYQLHMLESNPTMEQWGKYYPMFLKFSEMEIQIQIIARSCQPVETYCQENDISILNLFNQLAEEFGEATDAITYEEIRELEYDTAVRVFENTQAKLAENNDGNPEFMAQVARVVLRELYMVRLLVDFHMPDEDEDPDVRCKHLRLNASITSYMLSAMIYPNGKPMSIFLGDRAKEVSDLKDMYNEIQTLDSSFVPPVLPSVEGVSPPSSSGGCYVATAVYGSYDCPEVWTLRRFRDYTLAKTWYGRAFIHTYYAISPALVKWFGHTEWFNKMWRPVLNKMVEKLNDSGVENTAYCDKDW